MTAAMGAVAGCGDDGCPALRACDIRERGCQRSIMEAVACMRGGGESRLPEVEVLDRPGFLARLDQERAAEEDPEQAAANAEAFARWNAGLALFGLAPAEYDQASARADALADVAAVYSLRTKKVLVISEPQDEWKSSVAVLAHEFVHALQDAELDLRAFQKDRRPGLDASLALSGLIEGEATHYQLLAMIALAGRSEDDADWERTYSRVRADELRAAELDAAPYVMARSRFAYAFGGGFVAQHWLAGGRAAIEALFEQPPQSTREIMFGADADPRSAESARAALHDHAVPQLRDGYESAGEVELGAWMTRVFAARTSLAAHERLAAPRALGADLFAVRFDPAAGTTVATWRARALAGTSLRLWPALTQFTGSAVDGFQGADVHDAFAAASDDAALPATRALVWEAAPPAEDGEGEDGDAEEAHLLAPFADHLLACRARALEVLP